MSFVKSLLEIVGLTSLGMIGGAILGYGLGTLIAWLISMGAEPNDPLDGLPIILLAVTFLCMAGGAIFGFVASIYFCVRRWRQSKCERIV